MEIIDRPTESLDLSTEVLVLLDIEFGLDNLTATDHLLADGYLDSLAITELVLLSEETFGVIIEDVDLTEENFATVTSIAALISRLSR